MTPFQDAPDVSIAAALRWSVKKIQFFLPLPLDKSQSINIVRERQKYGTGDNRRNRQLETKEIFICQRFVPIATSK